MKVGGGGAPLAGRGAARPWRRAGTERVSTERGAEAPTP